MSPSERSSDRAAAGEGAVGLDRLVDGYARRGAWIPLAVAHALAEDLAAEVHGGEADLSLQDVELRAGRARLRAGPAPSSSAVAGVIRRLLGGEGDRELPPSARPLLPVLAAVPPRNRAEAEARIRAALRAHLPPPALPDEIARACAAAAGAPVEEEEAWRAAPTEIGPRAEAPPALDIEALTGVSAPDTDPPAAPPSEAGDDWAERARRAERSMTRAAGGILEGIAREGSARPPPDASSSSGERPVVRHQLPRNDPPKLTRAPAARRSARPGGREGDDAILSGDDRSWVIWALVLAGLTGALYVLFFR